jgi:S1-C subfamily serine protease
MTETKARDVSKSIVKVFVTSTPWRYDRPWMTKTPVNCTGSGFAIDGKRIVTNAHVVTSTPTTIQVLRNGDARKVLAKPMLVSHESDLAILSVDDDKFWAGTVPLALDPELPPLQADLTVWGFPMGGDCASITKGNLSRVTTITYSQAQTVHIALQTDASINGGNSGGPVLFKDKERAPPLCEPRRASRGG